ncbi:MAG: hypothetical protein ACRCX2_13055 [Paraclostridium sp.]
MTGSYNEAILNNVIVFVSCMNYESLNKYRKILDKHCISLINNLNELTEEIRDCVSNNAIIIGDSYLNQFEKFNHLYSKNNSKETIAGIINLATELSDAELEIFSTESLNEDIHSVSKRISMIINEDNTNTGNLLKADRSSFFANVSNLEVTYKYYCELSNNLKESINIMIDSLNSITLAMRYISKELQHDKGMTKRFIELNMQNKKHVIMNYILNTKEVML